MPNDIRILSITSTRIEDDNLLFKWIGVRGEKKTNEIYE